MRKTLTIIAVLGVLAVVPAAVVLADDDCSVPMANWQPRDAVMRLAQENGWTVSRIKVDDGCYEVEGRDRDGRSFEADLDPATLRVVDMDYDDDDEDSRRPRNPAAVGTAAPPPNGLFGTGAPPRVRVN